MGLATTHTVSTGRKSVLKGSENQQRTLKRSPSPTRNHFPEQTHAGGLNVARQLNTILLMPIFNKCLHSTHPSPSPSLSSFFKRHFKVFPVQPRIVKEPFL